MDFLYGLAFNLFLKLLFDKPADHHKAEPPPTPSVQVLEVEAPQKIEIPGWVTNIPVNGFVGISGLCESIEEARQQAFHSAISQILQAMGAEYNLSHKSIFSGTAQHSQHKLRESLIYNSRWFVRSIQQNIVNSDIQQIKGRYICFVLINFSPEQLERLRKLTIGPMVSARIIKQSQDKLIIKVAENTGVKVTITNYTIQLITKNRHAGIITTFAWKVPESSTKNIEGTIDQKISVKENSQTLTIPCPSLGTNFEAFILGSENKMKVVLQGYDEIGRPISFPVNNY